MLFSPSAFYQNQTFGATVGTVLDRHTGTIWAMLTVRDLSRCLTSGSAQSPQIMHLSDLAQN
jgi:hypothetical protein